MKAQAQSKKTQEVKTAVLNSRQIFDSEAEDKVKTCHRQALVEVFNCIVEYLETKKKPEMQSNARMSFWKRSRR